jgi:hypothetical protein
MAFAKAPHRGAFAVSGMILQNAAIPGHNAT